MSGRYEYKYLVPNIYLDEIRKRISPYVELDSFSSKQENHEYTVRSIYYDSGKMASYYEKIEGIRDRKKFRIRGYNLRDDSSVVFLEIKRKYGNCVDKNRAPLYAKDLEKFFAKKDYVNHILSFSNNGKEKKDANKFLYHYYRKDLHPAILIIYDREAFTGKFDRSLRVTFDKNIRSSLNTSFEFMYDEKDAKYLTDNNFVLEVKFYNGVPLFIQSIINDYSLVRLAISKYVMCLDSHKQHCRIDLLKYRKRSFETIFENISIGVS